MNKQFEKPINTLLENAVVNATALLEKRESKLSLLELEPTAKSFNNNGIQSYCDYNISKTARKLTRKR